MNFQSEQAQRPIQYISYDSAPRPQEPAKQHGWISVVLCVAALVVTPVLVLLPIAGFIPALLALGGATVAWLGLRGEANRSSLLVGGLIACTVVFALTASIATMWHATVVVPALTDYEDLGAAMANARDALFG